MQWLNLLDLPYIMVNLLGHHMLGHSGKLTAFEAPTKMEVDGSDHFPDFNLVTF